MCLCRWRILGVFIRFWRLDPDLVAGFALLHSLHCWKAAAVSWPASMLRCSPAVIAQPLQGAGVTPEERQEPQQLCCAGSGTYMGTTRQAWQAWDEWGSSPAQIYSFTCPPPAPCRQRLCWAAAPRVVADFWVPAQEDSPAITPVLMSCSSCSPSRDNQVWANSFFFWV